MSKFLFLFLTLFFYSNFANAISIDPNIASEAIFNVSYVAGGLISIGAIMMGVSLVVSAMSK